MASKSIFQEFNEDYGPAKFRIGLAGRNGGPDFYINMQSNIHAHGRGGQGKSFELPGELPFADVTFMEIIHGTDIPIKMQQSPVTKNGGLKILNDYIEIKTITIYKTDPTKL